MLARYLFLFTVIIMIAGLSSISYAQSCTAGFDCSPRGVAVPGANECGNGQWENLLVGQESAGRYDATARGAACPNCTASGRYQFIDNTRRVIGNRSSLPCAGGSFGSADHQAFINCQGLQDDYFRALVQDNVNNLRGACDAHCGTTHDGCDVTMSGLLAMAHNVGPGCAREWASGGSANLTIDVGGTQPCRDAFGTNAVEKYACAMGGFDVSGYGYAGGGAVASGCGFGFDPATPPNPRPFQGHLLGCDPRVLNQSVIERDALQQVSVEIARAVIQPPVPAEQMTCIDQATKRIDATGPIHANPSGPLSAISSTIEGFDGNLTGGALPKFDQIVTNNIISELNNLVKIPGSISSDISTIWSNVSIAFGDPSGLAQAVLGVGPLPSASADCAVMEDTWLLNQCADVGPIPNLTDIINNQLGKISGAIAAIPDRAIDQVCSVAQNQISGLTGAVNNIDNVFEDAVNTRLSPITDGLDTLDNNATRAINNVTAPLN